jgi:hypothetical protein
MIARSFRIAALLCRCSQALCAKRTYFCARSICMTPHPAAACLAVGSMAHAAVHGVIPPLLDLQGVRNIIIVRHFQSELRTHRSLPRTLASMLH